MSKPSGQPIDAQNEKSSNITLNQTIKFAVCVDSSDPAYSGRIRAMMNKGSGVGEGKVNDPEKDIILRDNEAIKNGAYKPWGEEDPYVCSPFMALHVNVIPKPGEAVKLLAWDSSKGGVNREYIGPIISNPGYISGDHWSNAQLVTSYGNQQKPLADYAPDGNPMPECWGSFPHPSDIAIVGRDNTDIILGMKQNSISIGSSDVISEEDNTQDGTYPQIIIRSGKFTKNPQYPSRPKFNDKTTFIQINTFPQTITATKKEIEVDVKEDTTLATLIEYNFDPGTLITNSINGSISIYKMPYDSSTGKVFMCDGFNQSTTVPQPLTEACKVIFTGLPDITTVSTLINRIILSFDRSRWDELQLPQDDVQIVFNSGVDASNNLGNFMQRTHPLYFRASPSVVDILTKTAPATGAANWGLIKKEATNVSQQINLDGVPQPSHGLAFTNEPSKRDITTAKKKDFEWEEKVTDVQQGVISAMSEKIYLMSYNSSDINGQISLNTNYGISQEKFVKDIDEKTNSLVRGELLLELLEEIVSFTNNHVHSFPGLTACPMAKRGPGKKDIEQKLENAKTEMLNKNIRIN